MGADQTPLPPQLGVPATMTGHEQNPAVATAQLPLPQFPQPAAQQQSQAWDSQYPWWARAYFQGGALSVVCGMLLLMYSDFRATQKEDAKNHREDMAAFRQEMRHQVDTATTNAKVIADAMTANQRAIDTNQRDILSILKVLTTLTEEVRRLKGKPDDGAAPVRHGLQSRLRLEGVRA